MSLPQKLTLDMMQVQWGQSLNPLLANILTQGVAINGVTLDANAPKNIPTTLSRMQIGWFITDILSQATVWRTQPFNNNILTLESSADTTINIWVF